MRLILCKVAIWKCKKMEVLLDKLDIYERNREIQVGI